MKAIILFSGGIDSTVVLALALERHLDCHAISFDYGQRHRVELQAAETIARHYGVSHQIIQVDPTALSQSALVSDRPVPQNRSLDTIDDGSIPSTYVPARNTLFLAYATAQAEIRNASEIHYGPNFQDRKPYPDCRPDYVSAFQQLLNVASRQGVEGNPPCLVTPLIDWDKAEIIRQGARLQVPFSKTHSCYSPDNSGTACGCCDACVVRNYGFAEAGVLVE